MKNFIRQGLSAMLCALLLVLGCTAGAKEAIQSPADSITVAEAISVAARMHSAAHSRTILAASGEWYQAYVNYGVANGFVKKGQFDSYTREIRRYELAQIIAGVFPSLEAVNDLERIPDVSVTEPYEQDVLYLYNAGVLAGVDSYGTFYPFESVKRSELSAITQRATDIGRRVVKDFDVVPARTFTDAYLMADVGNGDGRYGIANAWKYDNRFDMFNRSGADYRYFTDKSTEEYMSISRKVNEENEGIVSAELGLKMCGTARGVYAAFLSPDMQPLVSFTPVNGKLAMVGTNTVTSNISIGESGEVKLLIDVDIDLDKNTATAIVNNQYMGTVNIPDLSFGYIDLASTREGKGVIVFEFLKMYKNYVLAEHFAGVEAHMVDANLTGWQSDGFKLQKMVSSSHGWTDYDHYDDYSAVTTATAGTVATAGKTFEATTGKVFFSTYILLPEKTDGAVVSLKSASDDALKFETKNGKIVCNGAELYDYVDNAWYRLSVDADTNTGKAQVKINNKVKAEIKFDAKYFDGVEISFAPDKDAVMWFDDVELSPLVDHYDYPSAPVVSDSSDYNIGINICNLWRDSSSAEGWDVIAPFPEMDLYLGYYDEGLREVSDWETKLMAEHGIDFMHMCWYAPQGNIKNPIKRAMRMEDLEDGFMNSKYSEYLDFCIMWENGIRVDSFEDFKEYIWKYWVENYFKDDRYLRLDNKAVISVFNLDNFIQDFDPGYKDGDTTWSTDGAKAAIAFMKEDIKNYGYDGLIILITNRSTKTTKAEYQALADLGIDASYAYNFGTSGYNPVVQQDTMTALRQNSDGVLQIIPTVATGFNAIGRHNDRTPFITPEDHLTACEFVKQELTNYSTGTWKDKTLFISTWNEYSEGHFISPSPATGGWALLDNIKNTFTDVTGDHSAVDVMPTDAQKERINRAYPKNYSPIRRFKFEENTYSYEDFDEVLSYKFNSSNQGWSISHGASGLTVDSSARALKITASSADHGIKRSFGTDGFDAADVPILYVRMKTEFADKSEIFFSTSEDGSFRSDQYVVFYHQKSGEWVDYYIDLTQNNLYTGKITAIRFDPMNVVGTSYISAIAFLDYSEAEKAGVYVNGYRMKFEPAVEITSDGDFRVTGEARYLGFYTNLRLRYDWDRFTGDGVLKLTTYDDTEVILTVGSDKATVNGEERELGYTFSLYDGLPVFEMKKLCELLGYKYVVNGNRLEIQTCSDELYEGYVEENSDDTSWLFSVPGWASGWSFSSGSTFETSGGTIKIIPPASKNDPTMTRKMSINASDYVQMKVGVKYDSSAMKYQTPQIFFTTTTSTAMSSDKCINGKYVIPEGAKDGDLIEAVFDLTANANFTGTVTAIRFDPYNLANTCYIDYIRMYKTGNVPDTSLSAEFDSVEDLSKYTYGGVYGFVEDGFAVLAVRRTADPYIVTSVSYKAEDYDTMTVRIRYNDAMIPMDSNDTATLPIARFTTTASNAWNDDKNVIGTYNFETLDENGFIDLEFVLSNNELYTGTVTGLRFDPYQLDGPYEIDEIRLSKSFGFEFTDNSTSGWTFNNCTASASDGMIKLTATGVDVYMYKSLTLNCSDYSKVAVAVKYVPEVMDNYKPELFFTTTSSSTFTSDKCITGKYLIPEGTKEGMTVRAVFDLTSNSAFTGTLQRLRFDPFHYQHDCEVDFIRFYK